MKVKELRDYLSSLESKIEVASTNNIRGCENSDDCKSFIVNIKNITMLNDKGMHRVEDVVDDKTYLMLY